MTHFRRFGWRPQLPDARDLKYTMKPGAKLPASTDLRPLTPFGVFDQLNLGSCTSNAVAGALMLLESQRKQSPLIMPSRLFDYYNSRLIEHSTSSDAGASIRDAIKAVVKYGFCPEQEWPYNILRFAHKPSQQCYTDAVKERIQNYQSVPQSHDAIVSLLAQNKPVVIGVTVYDSLMSDAVASTGMVPMPNLSTETVQGRHAVVLWGHDDARKQYLFRNSWGQSWGLQGYGWFPMAYLHDPDLSGDYWTINQVPV